MEEGIERGEERGCETGIEGCESDVGVEGVEGSIVGIGSKRLVYAS